MKRLAIVLTIVLAQCVFGTIDVREDSTVDFPIGPFSDPSTGAFEVALVLRAADISLWQKGDTDFAAKNESTDCTYEAAGEYRVYLDATDTATAGFLKIIVTDPNVTPAGSDDPNAIFTSQWVHVLPANIYDSKYSTDKLQVDTVQHLGTASATPSTAGYVYAVVKDGTGTGEINTNSGRVPQDMSNPSGTVGAETHFNNLIQLTDNIGVNWADISNPTTVVDLSGTTIKTATDVETDTAEIGAAGAGLTAINLPNQTMDITGSITGNLSGSVGTVTLVSADGITATSIANGAIDIATYAADANIPKLVWDDPNATSGGAISLEVGTVTAGTTISKTSFTLSSGFPAVANAYPPGTIITITVAAENSNIYMGRIRSYTAGRVVTLYSPLAITPANADVAVVWNTITLQPDF
jgi:hypothetical protein